MHCHSEYDVHCFSNCDDDDGDGDMVKTYVIYHTFESVKLPDCDELILLVPCF